MKKEKGNVVDVLPSLLVIIAVMILIMAYINLLPLIQVKAEVRQLAREYLLEMESVGYLTSAGRTSLQQKLTDLSVEDIDLEGTTFSPAGYGNAIYLYVRCSIPTGRLNAESGDMLSFLFEKTEIPIAVQLMSTAKN